MPEQPLIQLFTKRLSPCSGCGRTDLVTPIYDDFFQQRTKGEIVKFILQVEVEADDVEKALAKKSEGTVLAINPRPPQQQAQTGTFGSRGQGSALPSHLKLSPTPTITKQNG